MQRKSCLNCLVNKFSLSGNRSLQKINLLNAKIENILQDKLGTRFDTIYDYAEENPWYDVTSELLVLYDFPKGFDEQGLAGLRNILRNGRKCGIYTLILYLPTMVNGRDEFVQVSKQSNPSLL